MRIIKYKSKGIEISREITGKKALWKYYLGRAGSWFLFAVVVFLILTGVFFWVTVLFVVFN